jgi:uncharacterized protein with HXXEE motif
VRVTPDVLLERARLQDAVLLYPVATVLHVLEEWPRFPRWARRFASPRYGDREYVVTHVFTIALAVAAALVVRAAPSGPVVFTVFALVVGPAGFCNALFHAGATVVSRSYCAGVVTGLVLYLPLTVLLAALTLREGVLGPAGLAAAGAVAAVAHLVEVGHGVFKRW